MAVLKVANIYQISFGKEARLDIVEKQLDKLNKEYPNSEDTRFVCGFLNRKMVEEKGWDTNIVDVLERTLGDRLTFVADNYDDFDSFIADISNVRKEIAMGVDKMFVLDAKEAQGVVEEIKLFTDNKLVMMYE